MVPFGSFFALAAQDALVSPTNGAGGGQWSVATSRAASASVGALSYCNKVPVLACCKW